VPGHEDICKPGCPACNLSAMEVLYKIFDAMSKESYGEICKYFGIDEVEDRQKTFVQRYSGYSISLCRSIFASL